MSITKSAMRGRSVTLQDAASSGNGEVLAIPSSLKSHTLILIGSAGIASGKVQPETADTFDYAGTWAQPVGGEITVPASTELVVNFEGVYKFIRCRISTVFMGGTVSVTYIGS